jgi:DMSO/TMAO reductase YedYZ molybdopterin-dependent catalytic subunit
MLTDPDLPLRQGRYTSGLRDERVAAWLGAALGILFTTCFITGLFSHLQQHPVSWFPVPSRPAGLYRLTQGIHIAAGIASIPVLLAKLWVVWPRFVSWPPFRRIGDIVERAGLLALVGGGIFMVSTGVANIAQWYPFHFFFPAAHYEVAWITMGAVVAHLGAKWTVAFRSRPLRPEAAHPGLSRRGFLWTVGAASGVLTLATIGQTLPGLRKLALLAPRDPNVGPQGRPVNRSAANAGVTNTATAADYRLTVTGRVAHPLTLTLDEVLALAVHEATLPISCVEGWSYSARWRGIRVRDLMAMAGALPSAACRVQSLERNSIYGASFVNHFQAHDHDTLLATHLDGQRLDLDHGYPLRLIAPDRPGVNQTKWITEVVVL